MSEAEQHIRERAYHLWIAAGRPDGQCELFWLNAQRDVLAASLASMATKPAKAAKNKPKVARKKAA